MEKYMTINEIILLKRQILTLVVIFGGDGEHRVLNVLIFIYLSLVEALVEVWRIIVLVGYPDANEFCYCNMSKEFTPLDQILYKKSSVIRIETN